MDLWVVLTVLAGLVVSYLLWAAADRWVLHKGRKGPVQWPILGATVEVLRNYDHMNDWVLEYFLRDDRLTFPCELVDSKCIFTADPANVEHILKTNFENYPKGESFHEMFDVFFGDGIFNADGEVWRKQRKLASYEFSSAKLRDFSSVVFRDFSAKMACILSNAATTNQVLDMQDLFMRFTMDSIFRVTFGYEVDTLKPELPNTPFAEAFAETNEIASSRFFRPFWKLQRLLNVGPEAALAKSAEVVDDFIYGVLEARKADSQILDKNDLFSKFSNLYEDGKQLTRKRLRDTLLNFLIAGRDSAALTMSWFVHFMTLHPRIEQKLLEELRSIDAEAQSLDNEHFNESIQSFSELLTLDTLHKLHYLHACILETLRLYPVVGLNPKSAADDDIFPDGTQVRKGNMIMYAPYAMGRLPALWGPDATEYRPERWLVNGVVQQESPFKFVAFQAGPRICVGKDSAMLQLRIALATVFRFFTFKVVPGSVVRYRQMSTLLLDNGLPVTVAKRDLES